MEPPTSSLNLIELTLSMSCFSLPINIALLSFFFWQLFLLLDLTWLDIDAGSFSRHHLLLLMTLLHISLVSSLEKRL